MRNLRAIQPWKYYLLLAFVPWVGLLARGGEEAPDFRLNIPKLALTVGRVGIADHLSRPTRYGIELRLRGYTVLEIIPTFGYAQAESGANFLYTELRHDFWVTDRWIVVPSLGLGLFNGSKEIRLGSPLDFRSGLEIAYRIYEQYRFGVAVYHTSNGGISNYNPGTEELVAVFSIPLT